MVFYFILTTESFGQGIVSLMDVSLVLSCADLLQFYYNTIVKNGV